MEVGGSNEDENAQQRESRIERTGGKKVRRQVDLILREEIQDDQRKDKEPRDDAVGRGERVAFRGLSIFMVCGAGTIKRPFLAREAILFLLLLFRLLIDCGIPWFSTNFLDLAKGER